MQRTGRTTVWTGECIEVMRGMNTASLDRIYLEPPFNSNADYTGPIGSVAVGGIGGCHFGHC